jgi:cytochrome c553
MFASAVAMVTCGAAQAQSDLVKRGDYLVNTIITCGNCHSPKGSQGDIPGKPAVFRGMSRRSR